MATKTNTRSNISPVGVKTNGLGFQVLSEVTSFRRPLEHSKGLDSEAPRLILIFGFMNAPLHTLQKDYISRYTKKWPSAPMIVIRAFTPWLVMSQKEKDRRLMPAIEILLEGMYESTKYTDNSNGLLVHLTSNGGGFMFTCFTDLLERVLKSRNRGGEDWRQPRLTDRDIRKDAFEPLAIILDSLPSHAGIIQNGSGFVTSIKSPRIRSVAAVPASIAFSTLLGSMSIVGSRLSFSAMNARLLSRDIIPGLSDYSTPRLYFYSEGDEVVDRRDVEAHLRRLREAIDADQQRRSFGGFVANSDPVFVEKYGLDSRHILHVRTDAKRYWEAVDRLWENASRRTASTKSMAKL